MVLSPIEPGDEESLRVAVEADRNEPSRFIPRPLQPSAVECWVADAIDASKSGQSITLAARSTPARIVGTCRLSAFDHSLRRAQISFWTAPGFRKQGYATLVVRLASRLAADQLGVCSLMTVVREENVASRTVLARTGFRLFAPRDPEPKLIGMLRGEASVNFQDSAVWPWCTGQSRQTLQLEGNSDTMLIIRNDQMEVFRKARLEVFARKVAVDTLQRYPLLFDEDQPAEELEATILDALDRAWDYGLRQDRHLQAFGELAVVCGPLFDAYPPFHDLLTHPAVDPGRGFELLFKIARPEDWIIAGRLEPEEGEG